MSLIIVNYNAAELSAALIEAVGTGADEVVVVDNASPEGMPCGVLKARSNTVIVDAGSNLGYGAAANLGARSCTGDVLVVANPDVSITAAGLRALAAASLEPGVGLVAPGFVNVDGSRQRSAHRRDPGLLATLYELSPLFAAIAARIDADWHPTLLRSDEHDRAADVNHVLGALVVLPATVFRAVGGFDESFFLYREETDLCRRLRCRGWRIRHNPSVEAIHIGGASTDDPSPFASRPVVLDSHYRYIAKHRGKAIRQVAWAIGVMASLTWAATGPERTAGGRALRWHLGPGR